MVADEVRKLANNAGQATKEINEIVTTLSRLIGENESSVKSVIARTHLTMDKAHEASQSINGLMTEIERSVGAADQIRGTSDEQMGKLSSLNAHLHDLLHALAENTEKVQTTGIISRTLYQESSQLRDIMEQFRFEAEWGGSQRARAAAGAAHVPAHDGEGTGRGRVPRVDHRGFQRHRPAAAHGTALALDKRAEVELKIYTPSPPSICIATRRR